jgi:hypothetical protein
MRRRLRVRRRDRYLDRPLINYLIAGIYELDQDLMSPGHKALDNNRIPACVCPMPRRLIDGHMDVSNPRGHGERGRPKYRHDVQILRAIPNEDNATR